MSVCVYAHTCAPAVGAGWPAWQAQAVGGHPAPQWMGVRALAFTNLIGWSPPAALRHNSEGVQRIQGGQGLHGGTEGQVQRGKVGEEGSPGSLGGRLQVLCRKGQRLHCRRHLGRVEAVGLLRAGHLLPVLPHSRSGAMIIHHYHMT